MIAFFGHQSVGQNILGGIEAAFPDCPVRPVPPVGTGLAGPGIYHAAIGANGDPDAKIDSFRDIVARLGPELDVAMMKLCYVDVDHRTDVQSLFRHYESAIAELAERFQKLRIIHITTPLRTLRLGVRSRLRQVLGRPLAACEDNARREEYNALLRSAWPADRLFDLAALESTHPDGRPATVRCGRRRVRSLCPEYTHDGGHLNERASRIAADALLACCGLRGPSP